MMRMTPERVARATSIALLVGAIVGLVGGIGGAAWVLGARGLLLESVEGARDGAADLDVLVDGLLVTLETSAETLASVASAVGDGSAELARIAGIGRDLGQVVTGDVPAALDGVRGALPALEDSARVLDRTMRALSFVGVDYDADQPLDQSIAEIDVLLADIPSTLREQAGKFDETISGITALAIDAQAVSGQVGTVGAGLRDLAQTVESVALTTGAMIEVLDRLESLVSTGAIALSLIALVGGLAFSASQLGLWWWFRMLATKSGAGWPGEASAG